MGEHFKVDIKKLKMKEVLPGKIWTFELLTPEECDYILSLIGDNAKESYVEGGVGNHYKEMKIKKKRRDVLCLEASRMTPEQLYFARMLEDMRPLVTDLLKSDQDPWDLNYALWQYLWYKPEMKFTWHSDANDLMPDRIGTFLVYLSDFQSHNLIGGETQFRINEKGKVLSLPVKRGHGVLFDSWMLHQGAPVLRGDKHALVGIMAPSGSDELKQPNYHDHHKCRELSAKPQGFSRTSG